MDLLSTKDGVSRRGRTAASRQSIKRVSIVSCTVQVACVVWKELQSCGVMLQIALVASGRFKFDQIGFSKRDCSESKVYDDSLRPYSRLANTV